jgi:hypothetical protein
VARHPEIQEPDIYRKTAKKERTVRTVCSLFAIGLVAGAAAAQELSWTELAGRPELWPAQVTVRVPMNFQGGVSVQPGDKAQVVDFKGNEVDLRTTDGRTYFDAEQDETDALDVARAAYAKLTPKQRQLTYPSVVQQKDLWPYRVTIARTITLAPGKTVQAGDQVLVKDVQSAKMVVVSEKLNAQFGVVLPATDLMAQARTFVEDDQAGPRLLAMQREAQEKLLAEQRLEGEKIKAEGRLPVELEGRLINSVTGQPEPLDPSAKPRYIVFLRGSTTCPITRNFTPGFVEYYNSVKAAHPELEVVYLTLDPLDVTEKFAQEMGFSWRSVAYERTTMPSVYPVIDGRIPQLIVMDRDGKVLANGIQSTAPAALQQLKALLNQPSLPTSGI